MQTTSNRAFASCLPALLLLGVVSLSITACSSANENNAAATTKTDAGSADNCTLLEHFEDGKCVCSTDCAGTCVDRLNDRANCGGCGIACGAGEVCYWGACTDCTRAGEGGSTCDGTCTNVKGDSRNCGTCGHSCGDGPCTDGLCCDEGQAVCNGACVDVGTAQNCGKCGVKCASDEACSDGVCAKPKCGSANETSCSLTCVNLKEDVNNCGSCGNVCKSTLAGASPTCVGGVCGAACAVGTRFCASKLTCETESATSCGSTCIACASPTGGAGANGAPSCEVGACSIDCAPGLELLQGNCVPSVSNSGGPQTGAAWPVPGHDAMHTGRGPGVVLTHPTIAWSLPMTTFVEAGEASIDKNGDFVFLNNAVFDGDITSTSASGAQMWSLPIANFEHVGGIAIAEDGTLYHEATNANGYLSALVARRRDGSKKWIRTFTQPISPLAVASNGTLYFGDYGGSVHAEASNGTELWMTTLPSAASAAITLAPSIAPNGTLRIASATPNGGGALVSMTSSGTVLSTTLLPSAPITIPVIAADGTTYVVCQSGVLYAINTTGAITWQFDYKALLVTQPRLGPDGSVIVQALALSSPTTGIVANVVSLTSSGTVKWTYPGPTGLNALVVIDDGTVYTSANTAMGADALIAISANGLKLWELPLPGPFNAISVGPNSSLILQTQATTGLTILAITN